MPRIPRAIVDEMVEHALDAPRTADGLPEEICGLIGVRRVPEGLVRAWARRNAHCAAGRSLNGPAWVQARQLAVKQHEYHLYRIDNVADEENGRGSPYRYRMHPMQMMRAMNAIEADGGSLFAIYHSHVASPAYPSPTDVRMAFFPPGETEQEPSYPETYYILVSLETDPPNVRAFHIRRGGVIEEEPIDVVLQV